jgi:hypothetical protein
MWVEWNSSEDSDSDATDIQLAAIGLGYQSPGDDGCGNPIVERLPNIGSKPFNVNLSEAAISEGTAISLPDLEADMYIGIFLSRRILPVAKQSLDNDTLIGIKDGTVTLETNENFVLVFDWD